MKFPGDSAISIYTVLSKNPQSGNQSEASIFVGVVMIINFAGFLFCVFSLNTFSVTGIIFKSMLNGQNLTIFF